MSSQSFEPHYRLHYNWEYRRFFNQSQVLRVRECTVFRIPNELPHFRVGITFKARGSSVERNQVKRQVREYFRTHRDALGSYDYNVVIPGTKKISYPYAKKLGQSLREQFIHAIARS